MTFLTDIEKIYNHQKQQLREKDEMITMMRKTIDEQRNQIEELKNQSKN